MNSTLFLTKSINMSLFRPSVLFSSASECYLSCRYITSTFKFHTSSKNKDTGKREKINQTVKESDNFGTLRKPLEETLKMKHKSPVNTAIESKKRVIRIRKPRTDESDIFGNLSEDKPIWYSNFREKPIEDNDLSDDSVIQKTLGRRYRDPNRYLSQMKQLVKEKKIKDALNLFVEMRRQFVDPLKNHYTYMIGVCGRIGYTEMAFKLLRQMTDRDFKPSSATLTGLFNACAESPFPEYGLKKAHYLKEKIQLKNWSMEQPTYHAMIKAFGKCGDLTTAFKIVDEMVKADIKISSETYSFLLVSCISNKEAGFTYAVEVWRKMKAKKCKPDIFTFNLFLRAARDCDIGPKEVSCLLLQHWSSYSKRPYGFITKEEMQKEPILKIESGTDNVVSQSLNCGQNGYSDLIEEKEKLNESSANKEGASHNLPNTINKNTSLQNFDSARTNLLSTRPINGPEIVELVNIKTPNDRLNLIGGVKGFLQNMKEANIKPDIKTFALLLGCLPDNIEAEEDLLSLLDSYNVKPIVDFFNILIKRRNFRKETEAARKVLLLLNKYELTPDIMTFGALTLGCRTFQQASTFVGEMKKFGLTPNIEIVGSLGRQASMILDFSYMKFVLKLMEEEDIKPDEKFLRSFENALSAARKNIILMEQGKEIDEFYHRKNLTADFKEFLSFYEEWLKRMKYQSERHPWLQYKTEIIDKVKEENFIASHNN